MTKNICVFLKSERNNMNRCQKKRIKEDDEIMLKSFLELSLEEIDKAFDEAFKNMTNEEKEKLYEEANIYSYLVPITISGGKEKLLACEG